MSENTQPNAENPADGRSDSNGGLGIFDPARTYLVVAGGDGYETHIVTGDTLEEMYLRMIFGDASQYPEDCSRDTLLEDLRDEDGHWESNWYHGPTRYRETFEDGYIEVIRMTPNAKLSARQRREEEP